MDGFGARQRALEGGWYRQEDVRNLQRRAERLRAEGKLPNNVVNNSESLVASGSPYTSLLDVPSTVNSRRACEVPYAHTPSHLPAPRVSAAEQWARLGTSVSFGRGRWDADGTSIFAVQTGKEYAQTPQRLPTAFEAKRASKIAKAALETPLVSGYRLLPQLSPGRAFLWGSILALWGTAGLAMSTARHLDIHSAAEAGGKLRQVCEPVGAAAASAFKPLRNALPSVRAQPGSGNEGNSLNELARQLKVKMSG